MITIRHCRKPDEPYVIKPKPKVKLVVAPVAPPPPPSPMLVTTKVKMVVGEMCAKYGITENDIFSRRRRPEIVAAKREMMRKMYHDLKWDEYKIARAINMDRTTVLHHLGFRRSSKVKPEAFKGN